MKTLQRFKFGFLNPIVILIILNFSSPSSGNFPLLDVDTNMRIVLVPHDMPSLIPFYRLKATDSDNNFPLVFEVLGAVGKQLLSIEFLGCSIKESLCQADVKLNKPLDLGRTYEFQLRVTDTTGDYTRVKAAITATEGTSYAQFMFGPRILRIAENTPIGALLDSFIVVKNELNSRTVLLELQEPGGRIGLKQKLLSNNRTEGTLYLKKSLDYETESWFTIKILALNGYTNITVDTRNVIVSEILVGIIDVQDTPPQFIATSNSNFRNFIEIPGSIQKGDLLTTVNAVDGDKQNKRLIRYGLLAQSNPFVMYFDLDPMSGEIRLKRNLSELVEVAKPNEPIRLVVVAEEIIPSGSVGGISVRKANESMATTELTFWLPKSSTILRSTPMFSSNRYIGEIQENSPPGTSVKFSIPTQIWMTTDEPLHLAFENYYGKSQSQQDGFEVIPNESRGNTTFEVRLMNSVELDYETLNYLKLKLRAMTETGIMSYTGIEIFIRDDNDCKPIFTKKDYYTEIHENSPPGTSLTTVQATDCDSGSFGEITYSLIGSSLSEAFHIDPITGEIRLDNPTKLDYELEKEIHLHIQAKDGGFLSPSIPESANSNKEIRNIATCTVIVKVLDSNDSPPIFESKTYQAILTPELDALKWPLQVKAYDGDAEGTPNSQIRYQVLGDNRFIVDAVTGDLRVRTPLRYPQTQRDSLDSSGPYLGSFQVKAYDLGLPKSLSSEATVEVYSEDVVSQEIQFLFPTSPDRIRKQRFKIEQMLSSLTGGHVNILDVSAYDAPPVYHHNLPNSGLQSQFRARSNNIPSPNVIAYASNPSTKDNGESRTVVVASVKSPLNGKSRVFDLDALKAFMTINEFPPSEEPTKSTPHTELLHAGNQTLFWILIALIIFLLILFFIFLCCLFCPCCCLYKNRSNKSERMIESHTRERISDEPKHQRRTRKVVPALDTTQYNDYAERSEIPRGIRQAWSGDDREFRKRNNELMKQQRMHNQQQRSDFGVVSMDDWEYSSHHHGQQPQSNELPVQYVRADARADEIGPRWQLMQHQHVKQAEHRNMPPYISHTHHHPGSGEDEVAMFEHGSEPPSRKVYGYFHTEKPRGHLIRQQQQHQQFSPPRSPTQSLPPPAPTDYRIQQAENRNPQPRFFRTEAGEVLQFDFDGDEGKEMLMRRFIEEQKPNLEPMTSVNEPLSTYVKSQEKELRRQRKLQQEPSAQFIRQKLESERPKAAATTSRRHTERENVIQKEIPEMNEDDEEQEIEAEETDNVPIPGSVRKSHYKDLDPEITKDKIKQSHHTHTHAHKSRREKHSTKDQKHHESTHHTHHSRSYDDPEESGDDERRTKRKSERPSKSKSKSRSKSPMPTKSEKHKSRHEHEENAKKVKEKLEKQRKKSLSLSPVVLPNETLVEEEATGMRMTQIPTNENLLGLGEDPTKSRSKGSSSKSNRSNSEPREIHHERLEESNNAKNEVINSISNNIKEMPLQVPEQRERIIQTQFEIQQFSTGLDVGKLVSQSQTAQLTEIYQHHQPIPVASAVTDEDDLDSGIGIVGVAGMRSKMLEKKSVFTIAYDEMATQSVFRPDTAGILNDDVIS